MPYGYLGTTPNQQLNNSGVFSVEEALSLQKVGELGGSLEHIETKTASVDSTIDFTTLGNYTCHLFTFDNMHCSDNRDLNCRVLVGGSVQTGASDYSRQIRAVADSYFYDDQDADLDRYRVLPEIGGFSPECFNGSIYMFNALNSSRFTHFQQNMTCILYNGTALTNFGGGSYLQANVLSGVRFYMSSASINSGDISLYGVKEL
jgi:hypothetical protein